MKGLTKYSKKSIKSKKIRDSRCHPLNYSDNIALLSSPNNLFSPARSIEINDISSL